MNLHPRHKRILLACVAAWLLLNLILPVKIPWIKIAITLGVAWAAWHWTDPGKDSRSVFFGNDCFRFSGPVSEQRDENGVRVCRYVFSSAALDLTDVASLPRRIEIQSAFSSVSVRLPVDAAVTIRSSGAFCSISAPGQKNIVFGENVCHCGTQDPNAPGVSIDVSCAFGSLAFVVG